MTKPPASPADSEVHAATGWLIYVVPAAIFLVGLGLWVDYPPGLGQTAEPIEAGDVRDLGETLLGGAVVAFAVLAVDVSVNRRFQQAEQQRQASEEEETKRRNTQLTIILNQALIGIRLTGQDLRDFYLSDKDLTRAKLDDTKLTGSVIREVNLTEASLEGANLARTSISTVDLSFADAPGSTFNGAVLRDVNFASADLIGVDFTGAVFLGAIDFTDAQLQKANFSGTVLSAATLTGATYDRDTKWPRDFEFDAAGALPED